MGKVDPRDRHLWLGRLPEFEHRLATQSQIISDHDVETTFENSCHPQGPDVGVLEAYESRLRELTEGALSCYAMKVADGDRQIVAIISEVTRRRCYNIRVRPGTRLEAILNY